MGPANIKDTKIDDEISSEFSYVKSDNLKLASNTGHECRPALQQHDQISEMSKESFTSSLDCKENSISEAAKHKPNDFRSFQQPHTSRTRSSYLSSISQYSGGVNDIAESVSVKVVNQDRKQSVSKMYIEPLESSYSRSTSSLQLGKLETQTTTSASRLSPNYSYNTNIESSVPPRSSRRPKSEILYSNNELKKDIEKFNMSKINPHGKRLSLSISDDLDKLMENAKSITESPYSLNSLKKELESISDIEDKQSLSSKPSKISNKSRSRINSYQTNESFQTADLHRTENSSSPNQRTASKQSLPPRPSVDNIRRAKEASTQLNAKNSSRNGSLSIEEVSDFETSREIDITKSTEGHEPHTPTQHEEDEDDYYDVDEPQLVYKPSKAKTVKDSTCGLSLKKSKPKRAKSKRFRSNAPSSHLKPFSYSTLINLLESMNGTVIGEEFSQLNLPIKEKQLIEKIIDSLSRLTSDMIIDKHRYEIGIARLEKALRALEGFM